MLCYYGTSLIKRGKTMNPKSNIKTFLFAHTLESIALYMECSVQTLYTWQKRGYAQPSKIEKLAQYPCSIMTEKEFLEDVKVNKS